MLTKAAAQALPIAALEHLPRHAFKTAGRAAHHAGHLVTLAAHWPHGRPRMWPSPSTSRGGCRSVSWACPFLRRFKVTVDQALAAQVTFAR